MERNNKLCQQKLNNRIKKNKNKNNNKLATGKDGKTKSRRLLSK